MPRPRPRRHQSLFKDKVPFQIAERIGYRLFLQRPFADMECATTGRRSGPMGLHPILAASPSRPVMVRQQYCRSDASLDTMNASLCALLRSNTLAQAGRHHRLLAHCCLANVPGRPVVPLQISCCGTPNFLFLPCCMSCKNTRALHIVLHSITQPAWHFNILLGSDSAETCSLLRSPDLEHQTGHPHTL